MRLRFLLSSAVHPNTITETDVKIYICLYPIYRMVKGIKNDPARYSTDEEKLFQVEKMLYSVKGKVLDGRIFLVRINVAPSIHLMNSHIYICFLSRLIPSMAISSLELYRARI